MTLSLPEDLIKRLIQNLKSKVKENGERQYSDADIAEFISKLEEAVKDNKIKLAN